MSSRIGTVLIIGATADIGEAFARRFHKLGKNVIAAGRNKDKLKSLTGELNGLETFQIDITDLSALPSNVEAILTQFKQIDTVIITAGTQLCYNLFDPSSATSERINAEITTNITAPTFLIRHFAPYLLQRAGEGIKTTLFITSSSLAYVPLSFYPTYCAAKAGVQVLTKVLRQQLAFAPNGQNFKVVEIVPPYTDTGLDKDHREATIAMQGGPEKAFPAMPLGEFVDKFFDSLEQPGPDGEIKEEIGVGFGELGVDTWRGSFGKVYEQMGLST
ncbi:hypothetical protein E8E14_003042 [Neopestalotiopsis sp. 37M]|nr:hypothetical protein E8E14_003042 [Neopestalotiopsis sp. 37M]